MSLPTNGNQQMRYTGAIPKNFQHSSLHVQQSLMEPNTDHLPRAFNAVVDLINEGTQVCVILRGLPGSGKSLIAHQLIEKTVKGSDPKIHIFSADQYFVNNRGLYQFVPEKLKDAHEASQRGFNQAAAKGISPIIADNTHLERWEMYNYVKAANYYGYKICILESETPWSKNEVILAKRNQHGVPLEKIRMMKKKYDQVWSAEDLLNELQLIPCQIKKRSYPPLPKPPIPTVVEDLIKFDEEKVEEQPEQIPFVLELPKPVFEDQWDGIEKALEESQKVPEVKVKTEPLPQRKLSVQKSEPVTETPKNSPKLVPHKKNCPNENDQFTYLREMYSNVDDESLWEYFKLCGGDANYCAEQLMDSQNVPQTVKSGKSLTCDCDKPKKPNEPRVAKVKVEEQQQSPTLKSTKAKTKQVDLDKWLETKKTIEESVKIGEEHFPDHVNMVKKWKQGPVVSVVEEIPEKGNSVSPDSTNVEFVEELHPLTIPKELVMELFEEFGGGVSGEMIKSDFPNDFPSKIAIKRSAAFNLYLEVAEAYFNLREEARFNSEMNQLKADEELALKLNEEFNGIPQKPQWIPNEESEDNLALQLSKQKLVELFPGLEKDLLMSVFASNDHKFDQTVESVADSLQLSKEEREKIKKAKKKLFNTPWSSVKKEETPKPKKKTVVTNGDAGYTDEHLKTVEDLRQDQQEHRESQSACRIRAQEAIQKKQFELATYFSNVAQFHKLKAEQLDHSIANLVSSIHESTQSSDRTVDLHFLSVQQAAAVLETFLDREINRIREIKKPYEDLYIITGWGAHSIGGNSILKKTTMDKLTSRGLKFEEKENNPGMLRVKVYQNSLLTNEFDESEQY